MVMSKKLSYSQRFSSGSEALVYFTGGATVGLCFSMVATSTLVHLGVLTSLSLCLLAELSLAWRSRAPEDESEKTK